MRVSAVIPVRNRPRVITRALDSVRAQTRAVDEVIVVDDGSTDDTAERVLAWRGLDDVRLLRLPVNGGAAAARNAGVAVATGEVIAFLDSDDIWLPRKIERQLALLDAHPDCPAVGCWFRNAFRHRPPRDVPRETLITRADLRFRNHIGSTSLGMVRRAAFEQVGGFRTDLTHCEDWELWLRLAALGDLRTVPEPLVLYHFDGGGRLSKDRGRVLRGHAQFYGEVETESDDPAYRHLLSAERHHTLAFHLSRHDFAPAHALFHAAAAFVRAPSLRRLAELPRTAARLITYPLV